MGCTSSRALLVTSCMSHTAQPHLEHELPPWLSPWALLEVSLVFTGWGLGCVLGKQIPKFLLGFQEIIMPQVVTGIAANILNAAMNAFLLYALKLGMV